jgi:hypothetical protein
MRNQAFDADASRPRRRFQIEAVHRPNQRETAAGDIDERVGPGVANRRDILRSEQGNSDVRGKFGTKTGR